MITLATIAILSVAPSPELRDWPVAGGFDVVQLDEGCAVTAEYPLAGRSPVTLTVFHGQRTSLALTSADWSSREGEKYALTFLLGERGYTGEVTGLAPRSGQRGFAAAFGDDFIDAFAAASSMFVTRGESVVAHLNLEGTAAAVSALRRCRTYVDRENAAQAAREARLDYIAADPFADSEPEGSPPPTATGRPAVITNVIWSRPPRPQFPPQAASEGLRHGGATLQCAAATNGRLSGCRVISETPERRGFGQEALAAATEAQLSPRSTDGAADGALLQFRVSFSLD